MFRLLTKCSYNVMTDNEAIPKHLTSNMNGSKNRRMNMFAFNNILKHEYVFNFAK